MEMNEGESPLEEACRRGLMRGILDEYIASCEPPCERADETQEKRVAKRRIEAQRRFPNLAGFCRYLGCNTDELLSLADSHPSELGQIRAILEDEALNASLSPTVIGTYLKKRLGYEKETDAHAVGDVQVHFEHDIWEDGE